MTTTAPATLANALAEVAAGSLTFAIEHNPHKAVYDTVEQYLAHREIGDDELSAADRAAMIAADEVWEVQCYPTTPVGFILALGPDLIGPLNQIAATLRSNP